MTNAQTTLPRPEYPRPQFVRTDWLNLNGPWQFERDPGDSGLERGVPKQEFSQTIQVPFCIESPLSGLHNEDFVDAVWYRRSVTIPPEWGDRQLLLHFQAVDYDATVWVNGVEVGRHRGGFTSFTCNLAGVAQPGEEITIVVRARDDHRPPQPRGKQAMWHYAPYTVFYPRTTGIWQTVWLEPVPTSHLQRPKITPDVANSCFRVDQPVHNVQAGQQVRITARDGEGVVATAECAATTDFTPHLTLSIPAHRRRFWSPEDPHLYDLEIDLLDASGAVIDHAQSYAGLRSVTLDGKAVKINGRVIFQRLVLDQGYYADGLMTAPSDEALIRDIELSMAAGFNGARLHQKVFEERFLYHADRLGYLVWGEFGDWGCAGFGPRHDHQQPGATYITQWLEALARDYSHPAIIGWCPLNETWQGMTDRRTVLDDVTLGMFLATKAVDTTRPVLDTSGYSHRVLETDIYDCHDYTQDPERFRQNHAHVAEGKPYYNRHAAAPKTEIWSLPYTGQPFFVSEFGGIWWNPNAKPGDDSWGYGERPRDIEEFYSRFEQLCAILLDDPAMFGYCYTQLTDVFQEQNGVYTFARETKFDMARIRAAQTRPAAIELAHQEAKPVA
ncbi:MAG: beta-galactosidase [Caldilineaceae bacterium]|nr:beta-galactosidase [Caldilineaceae bacterium]